MRKYCRNELLSNEEGNRSNICNELQRKREQFMLYLLICHKYKAMSFPCHCASNKTVAVEEWRF
jgi:hypothetical protein